MIVTWLLSPLISSELGTEGAAGLTSKTWSRSGAGGEDLIGSRFDRLFRQRFGQIGSIAIDWKGDDVGDDRGRQQCVVLVAYLTNGLFRVASARINRAQGMRPARASRRRILRCRS